MHDHLYQSIDNLRREFNPQAFDTVPIDTFAIRPSINVSPKRSESSLGTHRQCLLIKQPRASMQAAHWRHRVGARELASWLILGPTSSEPIGRRLSSAGTATCGTWENRVRLAADRERMRCSLNTSTAAGTLAPRGLPGAEEVATPMPATMLSFTLASTPRRARSRSSSRPALVVMVVTSRSRDCNNPACLPTRGTVAMRVDPMPRYNGPGCSGYVNHHANPL